MNISFNDGSIWTVVILGLVGLLGVITPFVTRKEILFGIRVERYMMEQEVIRKFIRKYIKKLVLLDIILLLVLFFLQNRIQSELLYILAVVGMVIIQGFSYITVHREVRNYKSQLIIPVKESIVVTTDDKIDGIEYRMVSLFWFGIPLIINLIMYVYNYLIYDKIPNDLKIAFDFGGNVTRMTGKSLMKVMMVPHIAFFTLLIFVFVYFSIRVSKKQLDASHPQESKERVLRFRRIWSIWAVAMAILLNSLYFIFNLLVTGVIDESRVSITLLSAVSALLMILSVIILALYTGQGGSRLKVRESESFEKANRNDDDYWKFGMFYVNKDDPAFMIEKRFGIGWTINFGNKKAVTVFIAAIAILIIMDIITNR